jgi:hypothetical protein
MPQEVPRASKAIDPGTDLPVGNTPTPVLDDDDADRAIKFILQNNSDTEMIVTLDADGGPGIHLLPSGVWEENQYAGPVWARHVGASGSKTITRIIF